MRLTVKILNGEECTIAASPSSYVTDIKQQVAALLSIPVTNQKLLFKGKSMQDNKQIREYNVEDGSRLTVVSVPGTPAPAKTPATPTKPEDIPPVWLKLQTFLRRHFTEKDADLVLAEFRKDFNRGLSNMSLHDIERLATTKLQAVSGR